MRTYIGIDNGVSGSIAILSPDAPARLVPTPTKKSLNYQKEARYITRVDHEALYRLLDDSLGENCFALLERPMVNPGRFTATASGLRAFEATLIALERLQIPYDVVDSRKWQRLFLPEGVKGDKLKSASADVGVRLFPHLEAEIRGHKDADALLIAEFARREDL